jgi:hypothetical protein
VTSLLERPATSRSSAGGTSQHQLPVVPRSRKPLVTVASVLLVLASIAIFAGVYSSADHRVPVLTVVTTIHQGQRIAGNDLGTADVATSANLVPIPASGAAVLSGTWAAVTLPAGSLLTLADVTTKRPLPTGSAVVGVTLKDGQLPSAGVEPGDLVMIVQTPAAGAVLPATASGDVANGESTGGTEGSSGAAEASGAGVLVAQAIVFETAAPSPSSSSGAAELVSVEVPATEAAAVATAAAASQVTLVLLPAVSAAPRSTSGSS